MLQGSYRLVLTTSYYGPVTHHDGCMSRPRGVRNSRAQTGSSRFVISTRFVGNKSHTRPRRSYGKVG